MSVSLTIVQGRYKSTMKFSQAKRCSLSLFVLQPAYDLAKEQKLNFGDDIASTVRLAKKKVLRIDYTHCV